MTEVPTVDFPTLWFVPSWLEAHGVEELSSPALWRLVSQLRCDGERLPAMFTGWALGGEVYRCGDYGCVCGWEYEYEPGEPMAAW